MTVQQAFELALEHHRAGRLAAAETLYQQVLQVAASHSGALHFLGVLAHQAGRHDEALALIQQAATLDPDNAAIHSNLGEAYRAAGRRNEAIAAYRRALELNPNYPEAQSNLGNVLREAGVLDEAIAAYRRAVQLKPDFAEGYRNLGMALAEKGDLDEAIDASDRALALRPNFAEAQADLADALARRGRLEEAVAAYRRALGLQPGLAETWNNFATVLRRRGQTVEAVDAFRRAIEIEPRYAEAHNNLGVALAERGRLDEAVAALGRALEMKADYAEAQNNLGNALRQQGRGREAIAAFLRALELNPDFPEAHNNLGNALVEQRQGPEAILAYRRAIELRPGYAEAYMNLGAVLAETGFLDEAAAACHRAIALKPSDAGAHSNLGNALKEHGELDEAILEYDRAIELRAGYPEAYGNLGNVYLDQGYLDQAIAAYRRALQLKPDDRKVASSLIITLQLHPDVTASAIAEEERYWNRQFGDPQKRFILPHCNDRSPERKLRIGYVSPDFRDHVAGRNLRPLFRCHDHRDFEIVCYSGVVQADELTGEFRRLADQWRETLDVTDEALAATIREDRIDILVDLSQHMAGNRLPVFVRRPAPVQVSFAGYPASAGVEGIENRISDRWVEGGCEMEDGKWKMEKDMATEAVALQLDAAERVYLIDSFWCYDLCGVDVAVNELPATENGCVTFGSLNSFCKINARVLKLWARVLTEVRDSRLVLLSAVGSHRQRTLEFLEREGIGAGRVEFLGRCPREDYLRLYHRVDIVLDTFPYDGHTTSLDALWMGVPVVSLAGAGPLSRAGLSILNNLGLPELVTFSEDDYVKTAADLARDFRRLAGLRGTLRARMEGSVLMDAPRFARSVEATYRAMWREWCLAER